MDVLDGAPTSARLPTGRWLAAGLVAAVVAAALLRTTGAGPPSVHLLGLDGSALVGESFVRLHAELSSSSAQITGVRLLSPGALPGPVSGSVDGDRTVVQLDLTPRCPPGPDPGALEVLLRDARRRERVVTLPLAADGPVASLIRYRCSGPTGS